MNVYLYVYATLSGSEAGLDHSISGLAVIVTAGAGGGDGKGDGHRETAEPHYSIICATAAGACKRIETGELGARGLAQLQDLAQTNAALAAVAAAASTFPGGKVPKTRVAMTVSAATAAATAAVTAAVVASEDATNAAAGPAEGPAMEVATESNDATAGTAGTAGAASASAAGSVFSAATGAGVGKSMLSISACLHTSRLISFHSDLYRPLWLASL